jgi:hypothetical protein
LDVAQNGPVLLFHEVYDPLLEVGALKMGMIEGFSRSEELAGFVDQRFDVTGGRTDVLSLDIKDGALVANFVAQALHDALLYPHLRPIFQAPVEIFILRRDASR